MTSRGAGTHLAVGMLCIALLGGCTKSLGSTGEGFVSGDGTVTVIDAENRVKPEGDLSGEAVGGGAVSLTDYAGDVVVVPVWGSWCGPCRAEAKLLGDAARDLADDGVSFYGINSRDTELRLAKAFERDFDIDYQSLYDPDGTSVLAFQRALPLLTIPSFAFIDPEGRIAGRIIGPIDTTTLYGVIEDILGTEVSSQTSQGVEPEPEPGL